MFTTRLAPFAARMARPIARPAARSMVTIQEAMTADDARKISCYSGFDYTIKGDAMVIDAVQKFAAFKVGCLVCVDDQGNLSGVISERDYITKIALLGRSSAETKVSEIATMSSKLIVANVNDSVEACMEKMLAGDIRHLPLVNDTGGLEGIISIKDLVKTTVMEKDETIKVLSDFALGKGGHFGSE